jgi:ribosomal protein L11 methylase PrmA
VLVVLAADEKDVAKASASLAHRGAATVDQRPVGRGRNLLYARFAEEGIAERVTEALRADGWPAAVMPEGGGHLAAWQTHTRPVPISDTLWVCFPWSEFDRTEAPLVAEIDPGRAFGTGGHPSTRLLLIELAARLRGGETVLDVGCGSGVLAISAAKLGAKRVTAVDIRDVAVKTTLANASRNGVAAIIEGSADPIGQLGRQFDVVVANIGAQPLIDMATEMQSCLNPEGWIGLSGLSPAQLSIVAAAYGQLDVVTTPQLDDWAAVVARHHGSGGGQTSAPLA